MTTDRIRNYRAEAIWQPSEGFASTHHPPYYQSPVHVKDRLPCSSCQWAVGLKIDRSKRKKENPNDFGWARPAFANLQQQIEYREHAILWTAG